MSHHDSIRQSSPKVVSLQAPMPQSRDLAPDPGPQLIIPGQGALTFTIPRGVKEASILFSANLLGSASLLFKINEEDAGFYHIDATSPEGSQESPISVLDGSRIVPDIPDGYPAGIDSNEKCVYWVSIDSINKVLRYGKGEMRLKTILREYHYGIPPTVFTKDIDNDPYPFIQNVRKIEPKNVNLAHAWIEPITTEPPVSVLPSSEFTMDQAASAENIHATPTDLSPECQVLYGNVAGEKFSLNTPDFPDFEQALEYSIRTEGCLAWRIIDYKLRHSSFKKEDEQTDSSIRSVDDDYVEVYLRITLGVAQGGSPGVPYVMEIWPPGCGSPIHNHGNTHAIIKVLRGTIDVDFYRMLPGEGNSLQPYSRSKFGKGAVTYIMPQTNQIHRLRCDKENAETCITIQCYSYAKDDDVHYPTFDYIEDGELGHFDPISDYDFAAFKAEIKQEWEDFLRQRFWAQQPYPPADK